MIFNAWTPDGRFRLQQMREARRYRRGAGRMPTAESFAAARAALAARKDQD